MNNKQNTISMRCEKCGGVMEMDESNKYIICPYCGSKDLIVESDYVKVETIKSNNEVRKEEIEKKFDLNKTKESNKVLLYILAAWLIAMIMLYISTM